jgi:hypothetical protein
MCIYIIFGLIFFNFFPRLKVQYSLVRMIDESGLFLFLSPASLLLENRQQPPTRHISVDRDHKVGNNLSVGAQHGSFYFFRFTVGVINK